MRIAVNSQPDLFDARCTAGASFSDCGRYRYSLWRHWGDDERYVNWLMLNPSTADHEQVDPTVARCLRWSREWGFDGALITNLFAFRATDPDVMKAAEDPVGPENDLVIAEVAAGCEQLICAWGNDGAFLNRGRQVYAALRELGLFPMCLTVTSTDEPGHPLYLPARLQPKPFEYPPPT